jgi:hypothetical protein
VFWQHVGYDYGDTGWINPAPCRKYQEIMNKPGAAVPHDAGACQHFAPSADAPRQWICPDLLKRLPPWKK